MVTLRYVVVFMGRWGQLLGTSKLHVDGKLTIARTAHKNSQWDATVYEVKAADILAILQRNSQNLSLTGINRPVPVE